VWVAFVALAVAISPLEARWRLAGRTAGAPCIVFAERRGALLVSGDHIWRLVDAIHDLQAALESLAFVVADVGTPVQAAALAERRTADRGD
jgi:hypothetical protein